MDEFQVMAANNLRSGRVVYLAKNGHWSDDFMRSDWLAGEADIAAAESRAALAVESDTVVDPYLVKVIADRSGRPAHIREQIRLTGPTCLPHQLQPRRPVQ